MVSSFIGDCLVAWENVGRLLLSNAYKVVYLVAHICFYSTRCLVLVFVVSMNP